MKLSDAEWQVMTILWEHHPATARDIVERLPEDKSWAYTTVKTMLSRLVEKKAVAESKRGNVSIYKPMTNRDEARRSAVRSLLDKAFGGAVSPLINFVAEERGMSAERREELIAILDELERREED